MVSTELKLIDEVWLRNERGHYALVGLWPGTANEAIVEVGSVDDLIALAKVLRAWVPFDLKERKREIAHYEAMNAVLGGDPD